MKTLARTVLLLFLAFPFAYAQPDIVAKFVPRAQPYGGGSLPYRLFIPEPYDTNRAYPLVLALHGAGERGTDNLSQILQYRMATVWADPPNQANHPCFVAAPQCPPGSDWWHFTATLSDLIDSLARAYSIDTNRLYITGLSMGGFGTWEMITLYPGRFAAAVPMSAGADPATAGIFAATPVWNFHGALDAAVPIDYSRQIMSAIEDQGRSVVYTHCDGADCTGLPDSAIAMYVESHADVFYTEYRFGGHVIWTESYDYPHLIPWVFDKYRLTPGAVTLTDPVSYHTLSGTASLTWTGGTPSDSVELWFSPDGGRTWRLVERSVPNAGSYAWATSTVEDCALGVMNIFLKDSAGHIYGRDRSSLFAVNNTGNGTPSVSLLRNRQINSPEPITQDTVTIAFRAADPEGDSLVVSVLYSVDRGAMFETVDSFMVASDSAVRTYVVHLGPLQNSDQATLRITAHDGSASGYDTTPAFIKRTPRGSGPTAAQTGGSGSGRVNVRIVDPGKLTGNLYRVTFADSADAKSYDVLNVDTGVKAVTRALVPFDGVTEGPSFDGIRLVVEDFSGAQVDIMGSRWEVGTSPYRFSISLPTIDMGGTIINGFPYPADYRITLASTVVDTSSDAIFGAERIPMKFEVYNSTENRRSEVVYVDGDGNGQLSHLDEIYILEPDSLGSPMLTWGLVLQGNPGVDPPPVAGDVFLFRTFKPIRSGDTFEFRGTIVSVPEQNVPTGFGLQQNWPNPFNPATTINYTIGDLGTRGLGDLGRGGDGGRGSVAVQLIVYDLLGRQVTVLVNEPQRPGVYQVRFDGAGLSSGVYIYRLTAGGFTEARKMVLVR